MFAVTGALRDGPTTVRFSTAGDSLGTSGAGLSTAFVSVGFTTVVGAGETTFGLTLAFSGAGVATTSETSSFEAVGALEGATE